MKNSETRGNKTYLFSVDVMIEDNSNARALQSLLAALNQPSVADFKIRKGIEFGQRIEQIQGEPRESTVLKVPDSLASKQTAAAKTALPPTAAKPAEPSKASASQAAPKSAKPSSPPPAYIVERINSFIAGNKLIRLSINKGRGVKLSVPCRIVGFDENSQALTVYHVDEKKVYTFTLNEIDDFVE